MDDMTFQLTTLSVEERLKLCDSKVRPGDLTPNTGEI
jgi:hypothetical protein